MKTTKEKVKEIENEKVMVKPASDIQITLPPINPYRKKTKVNMKRSLGKMKAEDRELLRKL